MTASPLSPRGGALPVWTGEQLLLLGGHRVDGVISECPDAASCTGPPMTSFSDAAAWDPTTGRWTHLASDQPDDPDGVFGLAREPGVWSGTQVLTRFSAITPDLAAGTVRSAPIDVGPGLVYADPVWTGDRLVLVPGAYAPEGSGPGEPITAQVYDPVTTEVRLVPWPFGPQGGTETLLTAWTGREVVAFVSIAPESGPRTCRTAALDPVTEEWRLLSDELPLPRSVAWDGRTVRFVHRDQLVALDVATGTTTSSQLPDAQVDPGGFRWSPADGALLASTAGKLLLLGERRHLLDGDTWSVLPELPTSADATSRTVAWAGEQVVVWGGSAPGYEGQPGENTADGWVFTP